MEDRYVGPCLPKIRVKELCPVGSSVTLAKTLLKDGRGRIRSHLLMWPEIKICTGVVQSINQVIPNVKKGTL